jgi:uncharacterized protein YaiE (UPF0345 family)
MATPSEVFSEIVSTTLRHHKNKPADNVTKNNGFLTLLKDKGKIKTDADGGYEIAINLTYAENSTYQRMSGFDTFNINQSDVITSAKYDWREVALSVTASGRQLNQNSGKARMINLVDTRVEVAMATAANNMSVDVYSDGSLNNQVGGLAHLIQSAGTGTVGGIDSSTYTFWQNKVQEMSDPTAFANLKSDMNSLWLKTCRGTDKTDLCILTHDLYSVYEGGLQDLQRYGDAKMGSLGFEALKYKSASVIFDDNVNFGTTDELGYFLNTDYLYLMEHPNARWERDDNRKPINQNAVMIPIFWMGQMCCSNRSLQGKLVDLS